MKGLILAAGKGTRLRPLTDTRPKPMIPLANKPVLEYVINAFREADIKEITIVVDEDSPVKEYFGNGSDLGVVISYAIQKERLGTAHAISMADFEENFVVTNGDNLIDSKVLEDIIAKHEGNIATLGLFETDNPEGLGQVKVKDDKVVGLAEKPKKAVSKLVNTGTIAFSPAIFKEIKNLKKSKRGEYEITEAILNLIKKKKNVGYVKTQFWRHISYPWDILKVNKEVIDSIEGEEEGSIIEDGVTINGEVQIGKGTLVKSGSYIEGPVVIGKNCVIGPNCFIRDHASIGDNCRVGQAVEIKNTVVMEGSKLSHLSYIGDSVVGSNTNFGAGVIVTNLRFDNANIKVNVKGKLVDTGLRKFGAVIGDNVRVGSNVSINPGRTIGHDAMIWPNQAIHKNVKEKSKIR